MLKSKFVKGLILLLVLFLVVFAYTSVKILLYSKQFSVQKSDVAIVLGAGSRNGKVSPVFRERINHSLDLY
jgi:vancomycin permeability regulator SanA